MEHPDIIAMNNIMHLQVFACHMYKLRIMVTSGVTTIVGILKIWLYIVHEAKKTTQDLCIDICEHACIFIVMNIHAVQGSYSTIERCKVLLGINPKDMHGNETHCN